MIFFLKIKAAAFCEARIMVMNLRPGYYDVFSMAPFKVKSPKSLFAFWHLKRRMVTIIQCTIFIGEGMYLLLISISFSFMAQNEVP